RLARSAAVASSFAASISDGSAGLTISVSGGGGPESVFYAPSGGGANSSCDIPIMPPPLRLLSPTTRKRRPALRTVLSGGAEAPLRRVVAEDRDRPVAIDLRRADHPAALRIEDRELEVVPRDALNLYALERHLLAGHLAL